MKDNSFKDFVLEQLHQLYPIVCRSMFGGYGLYKNGYFFGIIHQSRIYFKVSEKTRESYIETGMGQFNPSKKTVLKSYFEVPLDIIENSDKFSEWARSAVESSKLNLATKTKSKFGLTPEDILKDHTPKIKNWANKLRSIVKDAVSDAAEYAYPGWHAIGYRHPVAGYFFGIFPFERDIKIYFEFGAQFSDPDKILEGNQKQVRFISIKKESQINKLKIKKLLIEAIELKSKIICANSNGSD